MRKKWKYYIDRMLTFALIGILLPLFITIICQRMRLEEVIYGTYDAITEWQKERAGRNWRNSCLLFWRRRSVRTRRMRRLWRSA